MHIAGPLWALALVANAACMHALSASGSEAHAPAAFVTPIVPLRAHAIAVPQCDAKPRPARPFAKTGTHTTVMAVGGKGGGRPQQRGGGGRQDKTDGLPNADRVYEYVRGGFAEKEMPTAEGAKNGMYEAFDSALRASSYNMFCSPLKPVNSPAAFKAEQEASAAARSGGGFDKLEGITTLKFSGKEIEEDPEEVRLRTMQQYAELDRLIKGDPRATSGNSKLIKMQRKAGKLDKKTPNPPATVSASTPASTKPLQTTGAVPVRSSEGKTGMSLKQKKKLQGNGVTLDLAGQLEGLKGRGESDGSGSKEKMEAYDDDDMVESSDVEEGYAELQKLLGHKAIGGTKRKLDSARFTGDLTKYRDAGMFKRVTLKDPLSRIYAQRLTKEPAPVSTDAVTRPRKPGEETSSAETFVDDVLESLNPPVAPTSARPPRGGGSVGGKGNAADATKGKQRQATTGGGGVKPEKGGKGRLVLNHSTHVPGLVDVLNRLVQMDGVFTVVPGQLSRTKSNSQQLVLRIQSPTDQGFKLIARKGTQTQEVFVVSDLEAETLEAAIAWSI